MTDLVTLDEAKGFLRVDSTHEDATIALMIGAASEAVLAHADAFDPLAPVPFRMKVATLARVAVMFDERTVEEPKGETRLLAPLRVLAT